MMALRIFWRKLPAIDQQQAERFARSASEYARCKQKQQANGKIVKPVSEPSDAPVILEGHGQNDGLSLLHHARHYLARTRPEFDRDTCEALILLATCAASIEFEIELEGRN